MQDNRLGLFKRKPALVARLVMLGFIALILLVGLVVQFNTHKLAAIPPPPPIAPVEKSEAAAPITPPPPLARVDLIEGAASAASAYAAGTAAPRPDPLIGRDFAIQIAFGCNGPEPDATGSPAHFEINAKKGSLKLSASTVDLASLPLIHELPDTAKIEAVEGFWIPRPWTSAQTCPPRREASPVGTATPPSSQVLGLAEVYKKGGSRILRRDGRPYESTQKIPDGAEPATHAYRLAVEGRIVGFADGQAVHCRAESPDHRPICLYGVAYSRVAFEDPETGKTIAEWRE